MNQRSIAQLVHRSLFFWLFLPCLCIVLLVGVYTSLWMRGHLVESNSLAVETLARHVRSFMGDATHSLGVFAGRAQAAAPGDQARLMADFVEISPHLSRLLILGPDKRIQASMPPGGSGHDFPLELSEGPGGGLILSRPFLSPATGRLAIYLGRAAAAGRILVGELNLELLQAHIQGLQPFGQGRLILTDAYGNIISHPDQELLLRQENLGGLALIHGADQTPRTELYRHQGQYLIGTSVRLAGTGWVVLLSTPATVILGPILRSTAILLALMAGMLLFVALRTRKVLVQVVVEPLEHFTQAIGKVAEGDYAAADSVHPLASSELALAEGAFTAMARTIRAREADIRESEARFRQLVENVREVFWVRDMTDERVLYVSPSFTAVFGLPTETLYADPQAFYNLVLDEDKPAVREAYFRLRGEHAPFSEEYRIRKPDGSLAWIRARAFPVEDKQGTLTRVVGIAEDVTEARRHQLSLESIVKGTSSTTGTTFFYSLTQALGEVLEAPHALVTEYLDSPPTRARTLACWLSGRHVENIEYALADTPSQSVCSLGYCYIPEGLQELFPKDGFLADIAANVYMGITLVDSQGRSIGHLAVLSGRPLADEATARSIISIFSARAGAELERLHAERAIARSLHEKEILLKEIHHRVKNNLQVISSLLNLQMLQIEDPATALMFEESSNRIRSIALVHEELYRFDDLAHINLGTYIGSLADKLLESNAKSGVRIELQVAQVSLPVNAAVPVGLILNELLTNAFKHAFQGRDQGVISVSFAETADCYVLRVADDGVGMPEDFSVEFAESLGMQLIHNLTMQLRGNLDISGRPGCTFSISFPKDA